MSEYSNSIRQLQTAAPQAAVGNIDANPDDAARALELEKSTGTPAAAIYGDLEGFEKQHKAVLAGDIVTNNPHLQDYINRHPMAAPLSSDDYGNLDEASRQAERLKRITATPNPLVSFIGAMPDAAREGWHKMVEAWGEPGAKLTLEEIQKYPALSSAYVLAEYPFRALGAVLGGATGAVHGAAKSFYQSETGDEAGAKRFARDLAGMAEMQLMGVGVHTAKPPNITASHVEAFRTAQPWLENGMEPPRGLHPEIDKLKVEANKVDLETLDESLKTATKSQTRERAPDMFAGFMRQHFGEAKIGISGEKIAELYGEKVPRAEDNLLGWIPGIKEQLEAARETGQDIQIPIADWLAKVDPTLARELHDDTRVRPGNITKAEAELEAKFSLEDKPDLKPIPENLKFNFEPPTNPDGLEMRPARATLTDEAGRITHEMSLYPRIIDEQGSRHAVSPERHQNLRGDLFDEFHNKDSKFEKYYDLQKIENNTRWMKGEKYPGIGPAFYREVAKHVKEQYGAKLRVDVSGETSDKAKRAHQVLEDAGYLQRQQYGAVVDSPLAQVRKASTLEPAFSIGDRKLTLERIQELKDEDRTLAVKYGPDQGFHDFKMIDETGRDVGTINLSAQKGGKQLYIEMINGINGLGPRDFGPSLMRDLLRQLKAEFPKAETITGHRVSGARDKAGSFDRPSAQPVVKLDTLDANTIRELQDALQMEQWERYSQNLSARPVEWMTETQRKLAKTVEEELQRIVPKKVDTQPVGDIEVSTDRGTKQATGAYIQYNDRNPLILYSLATPDVVGVARHEAIHHLRQYGFFTEADWKILSDKAKKEGWVDEKIERRYNDIGAEAKIEEGVAEAFRAWAKDKDSLVTKGKETLGLEGPVARIFRKLQDFLDAIGKRFKEILGHEPTWEELFESAFKGEIGSREGGEPLNPEAFRLSIEDRADMLRANTTGLDLVSFKRLQKLIEKRHEEDYAAALKRAEREQKVRQSEEWKAKAAEIRPQVVKDIRARPDIAADGFLRDGELFGKKLDKPVRLRADDLTPEQTAALPKSYVAKSGAPVDEVANLFGFRTGDEMIQRLAKLNAEREASGKNPEMYRRQLIDEELTRRMEREHGFLEKNILEEARDQALSTTQLDILAEEMHAAGMMAKVATIDKNVATKWAKDRFENLTVGDVSSDHFMAQIGKYGREAERALIANKPAEAVQFMQKKFLNALMAKQAKELETQVARFDRDAKQLSAREIANMEPEYLNFIHQILMQVGRPVKRSVQDLAEAIDASGHKNLEEFVASKSGMLRELPVPEFLYDPKFQKPTDALTVNEFRSVQDAVKAMAHNGRDELKIYKAGEAADFNVKKSEMMDQLEQFAVKHYDSKGKRWMGPIPPGPAKIIRTYLAAHMQLENVFARWDKFDSRGVWSQYVMRDLVEGANQEAAWGKEYARQFGEFADKANMKQTIDNPLFRDPLGGQLLSLNRGNLRSIILNAGNEGNITKLAKGYRLEPQQVLDWIHQHATKEDWDFAQKVWDMFSDIKSRSDTMYRSLTGGVAPETIDIQPIKTPHGEYKGGYYPIIFHPEFEGKSKNLLGKDPLEQENYIRATTPAGYTKERTGYTAPLALDLDMLPGQIRSMLHDIALRPAVINASKVMYDQQIRAKIASHYGTEYRDLLVPYIRDVANSANYVAKDQRLMTQVSEFVRQNMISTLVGFNVGTVMKHGPTALVQSLHEVGTVPFLREMKSLFSLNEKTGETNWKFAIETSQELQRRDRNYRETLSGAVEEFAPVGKFNTLRQTVLSYASKPVALSDFLSAVPTWLAKYRQVMEETGVHGDAVFEADRAVRRAHGSTAITNRPVVMRGGTISQWFASVYGFFNHIMNRQAELIWRSGDTLGMVKEGEYKAAMAEVPRLTGMLFAYVLAPALIEEMVTPLASKDGESWGKKAAKGIGFTLGASWVGIRDISSALLNDRDPSAGLISTAFKQVLNVKRDLSKDQPLSKEKAGKLIQDATGFVGTLTGLTPQPLGRAARFGYNVNQNLERPKGPWGWAVGLRYGTLDKHSTTFSDWMKHH